MNKRIDELFGKALDGAVPETWTALNMEQLTRWKDKFAELIVHECTNIVLHYTDVDEGVAVAKKHFGVEE